MIDITSLSEFETNAASSRNITYDYRIDRLTIMEYNFINNETSWALLNPTVYNSLHSLYSNFTTNSTIYFQKCYFTSGAYFNEYCSFGKYLIFNSECKYYGNMTGFCYRNTILETISFEGGSCEKYDTDVLRWNGAFAECISLQYVYNMRIDFNRVASMQNMFKDCSSLKTVDLSSANMESITSIDCTSMFENCSKLKSLDLSGLNNICGQAIFKNCEALETIKISSSFLGSETCSFNYMFYRCMYLKSVSTNPTFSSNNGVIDLTSSTGKSLGFYYAFYNCQNITTIKFSSTLATGQRDTAITMEDMFCHCSKLSSITNIELFGYLGYSFRGMFSECSKLSLINIPNLYSATSTPSSALGSTFNAEGMFSNCTSLCSLILGSNFTLENFTVLSDMFSGCTSLTSLDLSYFNTYAANYMDRFLFNVPNLVTLTLGSKFIPSNVNGVSYAFYLSGGTTSAISRLDLSSIISLSNVNTNRYSNFIDSDATHYLNLREIKLHSGIFDTNNDTIIFRSGNTIPIPSRYIKKSYSNNMYTIIYNVAVDQTTELARLINDTDYSDIIYYNVDTLYFKNIIFERGSIEGVYYSPSFNDYSVKSACATKTGGKDWNNVTFEFTNCVFDSSLTTSPIDNADYIKNVRIVGGYIKNESLLFKNNTNLVSLIMDLDSSKSYNFESFCQNCTALTTAIISSH